MFQDTGLRFILSCGNNKLTTRVHGANIIVFQSAIIKYKHDYTVETLPVPINNTCQLNENHMKLNCSQMIAEIILLLSASSTGWYYKFMTHKANRIMFLGTRTCIESRIKLECEKEQQEQLLLSVIPAYIAAEVNLNKSNSTV